MNPSVVTQKTILLLLLIALGVGVWLTQTSFRAAVLFEQYQRQQEAWLDNPEYLTTESWLAAGEDLYVATLTSGLAEYYHNYALLLGSERTLGAQDITSEQRQSILNDAIEVHTLGVKNQPTHPIGWAYLARVKAMAGQFDGVFDLAMERIYTLGPWIMQHQIMVAQVAQRYWPYMSQNSRYQAASMLQLALSNPGNDIEILNLLGHSELLFNQLCPMLDQSTLTETSQAACQPEP